MKENRYRDELLILAARELMGTHGVFFAATLLADFGLPLDAALRTLSLKPSLKQPARRAPSFGEVASAKVAASTLHRASGRSS